MNDNGAFIFWGIILLAFLAFIYQKDSEFKTLCEESGGVVVSYAKRVCVEPKNLIEIK